MAKLFFYFLGIEIDIQSNRNVLTVALHLHITSIYTNETSLHRVNCVYTILLVTFSIFDLPIKILKNKGRTKFIVVHLQAAIAVMSQNKSI